MENKNNYLSTFRYYNSKGQRLSIFGKVNDRGDLVSITIIPCSKHDQFNKKTARKLYEDESFKRADTHMLKTTNISFKKDFINFCRQTYYRPAMIDCSIELLVKGDTNADALEIL